ncbi:MAG: hypothetical protein NWQ13_10845 [Glaciimonas sp.]|nr:hypothetical protein [Glaciimonas sp.]
MAIEDINSAFSAPNNTTQPELLISAVLHLMSQYTAQHQSYRAETKGCTKLASVIERHLKALAALPNLAPVLRTTCQQLSEQWATVVERTMPEVQRFSLLTRLVNASR